MTTYKPDIKGGCLREVPLYVRLVICEMKAVVLKLFCFIVSQITKAFT